MKWGELILEAKQGNSWILHEPFWVDAFPEMKDVVVVVPKGYVTDLASIPNIVRGLLDKDSEWAAVVHDYIWENPIMPPMQRDKLFRLMLEAAGVGRWRRWTMWWAVRANSLRRDWKFLLYFSR
jgi:hypothetical protein